MLLPIVLIFSLLVSLSNVCSADMDTLKTQTVNQFKQVDLAHFIDRNYVSAQMAAKKQRAMLPPSAVQFNAQLLQAPQAGQFSLVYDALNLWPSDAPLPKVTHSTFLQAENGRVIAVYVSDTAAKQLKALFHNEPVATHIYAIHIYNYAQGPRLIVIGAASASS